MDLNFCYYPIFLVFGMLIWLHIKSQPPDPIEKLFTKTHAPVFVIGMPEKF